MKREERNLQKGITLVALVVTIIVLLILAGVTIMTLFGENGLITMAQKAKSETENAQANTIAGIESLINEMNSILIGNGAGGGSTSGGTEGGENVGDGDSGGGATGDGGSVGGTENPGGGDSPVVPDTPNTPSEPVDPVDKTVELPTVVEGEELYDLFPISQADDVASLVSEEACALFYEAQESLMAEETGLPLGNCAYFYYLSGTTELTPGDSYAIGIFDNSRLEMPSDFKNSDITIKTFNGERRMD